MTDKVGLELLFLAEVAEKKLREYWAGVDMAERRLNTMQHDLPSDVSRTFAQPRREKRQ
jgi:hypothetical protein